MPTNWSDLTSPLAALMLPFPPSAPWWAPLAALAMVLGASMFNKWQTRKSNERALELLVTHGHGAELRIDAPSGQVACRPEGQR